MSLGVLRGMVSGEGSVDFSGLDESQQTRLRVRFRGDVEPSATQVAFSLAEAQGLIRDIPRILAASGGVPIGTHWHIMACMKVVQGWFSLDVETWGQVRTWYWP